MKQTELAVVNSLLQVIGESPLNEVDRSNPDVLAALSVWEQFSSTEQAIGYWYNTETWELPVSARDGSVYLPSNTTAVIPNTPNYIKRGRRLYDVENHTFDFSDEESVTVQIITEWDIDELPPVMFNYILAQCRAHMVATYAMDSSLLEKLMNDATLAFHKLQVQHLKATQPSALTSGAASTLLQNQPTR